jgi:hypothetical protein
VHRRNEGDETRVPPNRRGPKPGAIDRYGAADRALIPKMKKLAAELGSRWAAAQELARTGQISGKGTEQSKAKRMMLVCRKNEKAR